MQNSPETPLSELAEQSSQPYAEHRDLADMVEKGDYIETLNQTPGVDPVLAIMENKEDKIPTDGWLIKACISPEYGGAFEIHRYTNASFSPDYRPGFSHVLEIIENQGDQHSEVKLYYTLFPPTGKYVGIYENPNHPTKDMEPCSRLSRASFIGYLFAEIDTVSLENGGRLLLRSVPMAMRRIVRPSSMSLKSSSQQAKDNQANINRVVGGMEEVGAVLTHLGNGMDLAENDIRTFITVTGQKIGHID